MMNFMRLINNINLKWHFLFSIFLTIILNYYILVYGGNLPLFNMAGNFLSKFVIFGKIYNDVCNIGECRSHILFSIFLPLLLFLMAAILWALRYNKNNKISMTLKQRHIFDNTILNVSPAIAFVSYIIVIGTGNYNLFTSEKYSFLSISLSNIVFLTIFFVTFIFSILCYYSKK